MKQVPGRRGVAAAVVVVAAIAAGGIAYASIPDFEGVIHGCYKNTNGILARDRQRREGLSDG